MCTGRSPAPSFIPLAERAGSIGLLGNHVLSAAAADLGRVDWCHPKAKVRIGINVSPHQLTDPGFAESFLRQLELEGMTAQRITLEITEQAFARNLRPIEDAVAALSDSGIRIAVDDFGTGYSTLRYLQRLRPSVLKIESQFRHRHRNEFSVTHTRLGADNDGRHARTPGSRGRD